MLKLSIFCLVTAIAVVCSVAIATACAQSPTLFFDNPLIILSEVLLIMRAQAVTWIKIRRSLHPNRSFLNKKILLLHVL